MFVLQLTLKRLRDKKGLSQAALGQAIGVSQSTIGMWESGKNKPEYANVVKLAEVFNVPISQLYGDSDQKPKKRGVKIPVLGRVAAGIPISAIEDILDYEEIDEHLAATGEFFGLQIRGDSMEPQIFNGDVVIVRKQECVESGELAVVLVNGDEATVKKISKQASGLMLIPFNPSYEPFYYSKKDCEMLPVQIIGKVIELRRKF